MHEDTPRSALNDHRDIVKIDDFGIHDLRKTCATELGSARVPEETVSRILSHAKRNVTEKHYNFYRFDDEKAEAMALWSRRLGMVIAGKLTDSTDRAKKAEELEKAWLLDPTDGRPILDAIASALEVGELPPDWAVDVFVNAVKTQKNPLKKLGNN